jgi:hypothetical protein
MAKAFSLRVGKTIVSVEVERCTKCGTLWSYDWDTAKTINATIGKKTQTLSIPICGKCMGVPEPDWDDEPDTQDSLVAGILSEQGKEK